MAKRKAKPEGPIVCKPVGEGRLRDIQGITSEYVACLSAVGLNTLSDMERACDRVRAEHSNPEHYSTGIGSQIYEVLRKYPGAFTPGDVLRIGDVIISHLTLRSAPLAPVPAPLDPAPAQTPKVFRLPVTNLVLVDYLEIPPSDEDKFNWGAKTKKYRATCRQCLKSDVGLGEKHLHAKRSALSYLLKECTCKQVVRGDGIVPLTVELWAWSPQFRTLAQCWIHERSVVCAAGVVSQGVKIQIVLPIAASDATKNDATALQVHIRKSGWACFCSHGQSVAALAHSDQLMAPFPKVVKERSKKKKKVKGANATT